MEDGRCLFWWFLFFFFKGGSYCFLFLWFIYYINVFRCFFVFCWSLVLVAGVCFVLMFDAYLSWLLLGWVCHVQFFGTLQWGRGGG